MVIETMLSSHLDGGADLSPTNLQELLELKGKSTAKN
jgi:hypothetical protein